MEDTRILRVVFLVLRTGPGISPKPLSLGILSPSYTPSLVNEFHLGGVREDQSQEGREN